MSNQNNKKESIPHVVKWQIAYAARELRHKKSVTLNCLEDECGLVLEELKSFSNSYPITMKTTSKPNSNEVFLEIADKV